MGRDLAGIIQVGNGCVYTDSTAILEICARLPRPWNFIALLRFIPRSVRDILYRWITRHRNEWFGPVRDVPRSDAPVGAAVSGMIGVRVREGRP